MNRKLKIKSLQMGLIGSLLLALSACGPKQHLLNPGDKDHGSFGSYTSDCNQVNLDAGYAQIWAPNAVGYQNHVVVKFSQNPLEAANSIQFAKWSDEDMSTSYPAAYRARTFINNIEIPLMATYEASGILNADMVDYLKNQLSSKGINVSGNYFSKIEFLIEGLDYQWKGLNIFKGQAIFSALLPPFELQYSEFEDKKPAALHPFHPLYGKPGKTQQELANLEAAYCSLF